jgi:hypothetical protein
VLRRFCWTLLAAGIGALSAFIWAMLFVGIHAMPNLGFIALLILAYTAYAWLLFILPLTLSFRETSRIYRPKISIPLGLGLSLVAFFLAQVAIGLYTRQPLSPVLFAPNPVWTCPMLFGACVALTLSILADRATSRRPPRRARYPRRSPARTQSSGENQIPPASPSSYGDTSSTP